MKAQRTLTARQREVMIMAGSEIEPVVQGTVQAYDGGGHDIMPYVPGIQHFDVPDYVVIRPPETGGVIQDRWSKIMTPFRAVAHGFLWITLYWWRTAILLATLAGIVVTFKMT